MQGLKNVRRRRDDAMTRVDWAELERLLAAYYRGQGWKVEHCGTGSGAGRFDGGIDLKLRRQNEYVLVQCKHWNAKQVPHNAVHELLGIMVNEGATGAMLVSSGEFTRAAQEAADRQGHVRLIDGDALRDMLGPIFEASPIESSSMESSSIGARRRAMASPYADTMRSMASVVGERMLSAAEDRIRGEASRTGTRGSRTMSRAANAALILALSKIAMAILLFLFLWFGMRMFVDSLQRIVTPAPRPTTAVDLPAPQPPPQGYVAQAAGVSDDRYAPQVETPPAPRVPTPAEMREAQRRADEAIKVIEKTTPEM